MNVESAGSKSSGLVAWSPQWTQMHGASSIISVISIMFYARLQACSTPVRMGLTEGLVTGRALHRRRRRSRYEVAVRKSIGR